MLVVSSRTLAADRVHGTGWTRDSCRIAERDIVITFSGEGDPPPLDGRWTEVRETVPDLVPVVLAQENGRETELPARRNRDLAP